MDVAVLLLFTIFCAAVVIATNSGAGSSSVGFHAGRAGFALAVCSPLLCAIGASSLFRRRARSAIGPREG
jgi:hypothetical protein